MRNRKPLTDKDGEVRELTLEEFKRFRPIAEVLPPSLLAKLRPTNGLPRFCAPRPGIFPCWQGIDDRGGRRYAAADSAGRLESR
jgi:hypothetical protein